MFNINNMILKYMLYFGQKLVHFKVSLIENKINELFLRI